MLLSFRVCELGHARPVQRPSYWAAACPMHDCFVVYGSWAMAEGSFFSREGFSREQENLTSPAANSLAAAGGEATFLSLVSVPLHRRPSPPADGDKKPGLRPTKSSLPLVENHIAFIPTFPAICCCVCRPSFQAATTGECRRPCQFVVGRFAGRQGMSAFSLPFLSCCAKSNTKPTNVCYFYSDLGLPLVEPETP